MFFVDPFPRYGMLTMVWLGMIVASWMPAIFWNEVLQIPGGPYPWPHPVVWYQLGALIFLTAICLIFQPLGPARDYLLLMLAFVVGRGLLNPFIFENTAIVSQVVRQFGLAWAMFFDRFFLIMPALMMTAVVLGRYGWRDLFLAWGRFAAPVRWSVLFPFPVRTWSMMLVIGCVLAVVLLGGLLLHTIGLNWEAWEHLPQQLPAVLLTAAFNAAAEEYVSRMLPLAVLIPVVGRSQAIALTAVQFGLAHWYGQPSGPLGVLLMTYAGWVLAKSMVETEGSGWAFCLHAFADVMIYSLLVLASIK